MAARKPTPANILDELMPMTAAPVSRETRIHRIPLDRVVDNPFQYRQHYGPEGLRDLATNIASLAWQLPTTSGLQQAPMARMMWRDAAGALTPVDAVLYEHSAAIESLLRDPNAVAQLAYGHRRHRAFLALANGPAAIDPKGEFDWPRPEPTEFGTLPVTLMYLDDQAMAEFALAENSQREDVSAIEEAALLQRMIDELGISIEDVGRKFGWSRSTTSNKLRLLRLPDKTRKYVLAGDLSEKHARTLLRLADAPAVLDDVAYDCRSQSWSTRTLDEKITGRIAELPGMPDGQRVQYLGRYGTDLYSQSWDYDWVPDGVPIVGPCNGCPKRVTFTGEPGPRCVDLHCHKAKMQLWPVENYKRQRQAAQIALDDLHGGTALVDLLTDGGRRRVLVLDKAASWGDKSVTLFRYRGMDGDALKLVVENQECGPECKCLAACYKEREVYESDTCDGWRPDPINAPDVYYACTDRECMQLKLAPLQGVVRQREEEKRAREHAERMASNDEYRQREEERQARQQKQHEDEANNRKQVEALVAAAAGDAGTLWSNRSFVVELCAVMNNDYWNADAARQQLTDKPIEEIWSDLVWRVLAGPTRGGGVYDLSKVQSACNRIAPPPAQPGPGESQSTGWQEGWTDDDESAYEDVLGQWTGSWGTIMHALASEQPTARVLLRLIEACPDKTVRGDLWRMHNSMAVAA
jgi:ParB-like chromosome segregation protein Spo0J